MATSGSSTFAELEATESALTSFRPDEDRARLGAVYTPRILARWVAALMRDHAPVPLASVLDPACGDGALLMAVKEEIPNVERLVGVDLSRAAVATLGQRLPGKAKTLLADALTLTADSMPSVQAVIMNPPWGAQLPQSRKALRDAGFELARGQCDSWDLFVEWSVRQLPRGTVVAAILPDALFLPEHMPTRRLLIEQTDIRVVARLGEGWFDGVYRGVAVVVFVVGMLNAPGTVRCIRLPHDVRRRVLAGELALVEATTSVEALADQAHWVADPQATMAPTMAGHDVPTLKHIEERGGDWMRWVTVGRGVEMGKAGRLVRCDSCGQHCAPPKIQPTTCRACGLASGWSLVDAVSFDTPTNPAEWVPLIVGEDVRRYDAQPSRWLRLGLDGLSYKDADSYAQPKLLVRKTGLGLNAAVDSSGSYTTQVVFHFLRSPGAPPFLLEYLQGVLCSRVLLAYYLRRSGETEWRSHPYVTPKVLATLPIPSPTPEAANWNQARAIASAAKNAQLVRAHERVSAELEVDRLVAGLFELDDMRCDWVGGVLADTQRLQAFAPLLLTDGRVLRPEMAA